MLVGDRVCGLPLVIVRCFVCVVCRACLLLSVACSFVLFVV